MATWTNNYQLFKQYTHMIDEEMAPVHLRGLMDFNYPENGGIPIEQVESVDSIIKSKTKDNVIWFNFTGSA